MLEKGCKWVVGNGQSIGVWYDRWINRQPSFRVVYPKLVDSPVLKVSRLIDIDTKSWNADLVRQTFLPFEAEEILNIPLSSHMADDILSWAYKKESMYTVKFGYH